MSRRLRFVTDHPLVVVLVILAITIGAASRLVDFRTGEIYIGFDPSTNALLPDEDEGREFYDRVRTVFGSDETIFVVVSSSDTEGVFTKHHLRRIQRMTDRISAIDGGSMEAAVDLGVLFGCHSGVCGKCATNVVSGLNNLSAPTDEEEAMGLEPGRRLMCQSRVNKGTVELDLD